MFRFKSQAGVSLVFCCLLPCFLLSVPLYGQTARFRVKAGAADLSSVTIEIKDLLTDSSKTLITSKDGTASCPVSGVSAVTIRHPGYITIRDTLSVPLDKTYEMKPAGNVLDEVVVTGQYRPVAAAKSLYNVKVLGRGRIRSRGAVTLGDVLSNELNARVMSDNVLGNTLILQGISGQNVKILIDGVPMAGSAGDEFDLSQFTMNNTERVEIIEGPLSVQYGTNALAGTINIISRDPEGGKTNAGINVLYESIGQYNADADFGTKAGRYDFRIAMGRNQFAGYSSPQNRAGKPYDNRSMNWNPKEQYFGNLSISRQVKELRIGVRHNQFHEDNHSKGAPDPGTGLLTAGDYDFVTNRWNTALYANGSIGKHGYLDILNSYQYYNRDSREYITNVQDESRNFLGNSATKFLSWNFRGSFSKKDPEDKQTGYQFGYELNLNNSTGDKVAEDAGKINDIGLYGSGLTTLWNILEIQPSLRYAYNNKYNTKDISFLGSRLPLIPSLNVRLTPADDLVIRASYAKGFRAPSLRELFYDFKNANHYIIGNPSLSPEIADNYIVSAQYRFGDEVNRFSISPFAYINLIENKIEMVQLDRSGLPSEWQNINVARTYANIPDLRTHGVTVTAGYVCRENLTVQLAGGWLQRSGTNSLGKYFTSYEASSNLSYSIPKAGRFNLFYKYNGRLAQFSVNEDGSLGDKTLQAYHLMDFSLTNGTLIKRCLLTTGIKNLFNVTDVEQTGSGNNSLVSRADSKAALPIAWGRSFFIKASYSIIKH